VSSSVLIIEFTGDPTFTKAERFLRLCAEFPDFVKEDSRAHGAIADEAAEVIAITRKWDQENGTPSFGDVVAQEIQREIDTELDREDSQ